MSGRGTGLLKAGLVIFFIPGSTLHRAESIGQGHLVVLQLETPSHRVPHGWCRGALRWALVYKSKPSDLD